MSRRDGSSHPAIHPVVAAALNQDELWDTAERLAQLGTWDWSPDTDELLWSDNVYRLLGYEPGELEPSPARVFERTHPADVARLEAQLEAVRRGALFAPISYRIVLPDGTVRRLQSTAAVDRNGADGTPRRLVAFLRDVTEDCGAERELAFLRAASQALAAWDSFESGARGFLAAIGDAMGGSAAALWLPRAEQLSASVIWTVPTIDKEVVERAFCAQRSPRGVGLAGLAWETRRPVTRPRTEPGDEDDGRGHAALDGMRAAAAFPALVEDGAVLAVVVVYSNEPLESAERLTRALSDVGCQLGTLLARRSGMLGPPLLTARELEVLRLAAEGLGGVELEARLHVSRSTVKSHFENIYAKLGVSSRVAAVARALRDGLIE